jgi:cadmium resistance protein CadD (predicted permease)
MDSKFRLNILDANVAADFGIKRSKEIQNASILLFLARIIQTIVIIAMQLYRKDFMVSDALVRLGQCSLHLIAIYLNKQFPLRFLKYHGSMLVISMIPMTIHCFFPNWSGHKEDLQTNLLQHQNSLFLTCMLSILCNSSWI